jgi:beta-N-acetylhexosaminidase
LSPADRVPLAAIFGCAGPVLSDAEKAFFAAANPLGFVLFRRNIESPEQVRALVAALRDTVERAAPVLVDQEGGRVRRLRPPHWHDVPPMAAIGGLAEHDREGARRAAWSAGQRIAADLVPLGIDVDCAPVCDVRCPATHDAIGDRAFGSDPEVVGTLAMALAAGLAAGGVTPVIKHMPGHGRAAVDSHLDLPVVTAPLAELERADFVPFRMLAKLPWGMTAHVAYSAIDPDRPGTCSPAVIDQAIRGAIGFDGLLLTDDLAMQALRGSAGERAARALGAGCDVALHCNGAMREMQDVASAAACMTDAAMRRLTGTEKALKLMLEMTSIEAD